MTNGDFGFNNLTGETPTNFDGLSTVDFMTQLDLKKQQKPVCDPFRTTLEAILEDPLLQVVHKNNLVASCLKKNLPCSRKARYLGINNLIGETPTNFDELSATVFMFLTNNMLTGEVRKWILKSNINLCVTLSKLLLRLVC
ncbi:hypothetical protein MRB53_015677 [Persea americana]|uniref:Uncharacterized protein n=1 Tax=Persea americana TaxID=3435 RepID=A0ACC2M0J4_PERAE|nr:hypothetical protein MRB53_015677 [Persea americana]